MALWAETLLWALGEGGGSLSNSTAPSLPLPFYPLHYLPFNNFLSTEPSCYFCETILRVVILLLIFFILRICLCAFSKHNSAWDYRWRGITGRRNVQSLSNQKPIMVVDFHAAFGFKASLFILSSTSAASNRKEVLTVLRLCYASHTFGVKTAMPFVHFYVLRRIWRFISTSLVATFINEVKASLHTPWKLKAGWTYTLMHSEPHRVVGTSHPSPSCSSLFTSGLSLRYRQDRRLSGPNRRSWCFGENKNLLRLPWIEARFLGYWACSLVTISTVLSRLRISVASSCKWEIFFSSGIDNKFDKILHLRPLRFRTPSVIHCSRNICKHDPKTRHITFLRQKGRKAPIWLNLNFWNTRRRRMSKRNVAQNC